MSEQYLLTYNNIETDNETGSEIKELWKALGQEIRELRKQNRLSQGELCARAGLNRTYISDIERGERNVSIAVLSKISAAFKMPLWKLIQAAEPTLKSGQLPEPHFACSTFSSGTAQQLERR